MRLIGYNRVSTEDQKKYGVSLDIQPERHAKWCEGMDHELVGVVVDAGVSAAKPFEKRPGGQELIQRLQAGEADGMLVTRFDRAFRIALDALLTVNWFKDRGFSIISIDQPMDITEPFGKRMFTHMAADAEYERDLVVARAIETSRGLRAAGKVNGAVPYGFVEVNGALYRDPATYETRVQIVVYSMQMGWSHQKIIDSLESHNIPAPGGKGRGGRDTGGRRWHKSTISRIVSTHSDYEHIPVLPEHLEREISQS
ncbi:MAG: recombinase family protein [Gammaproteobacteria bacterium]|nr:recombinase family protein [Gammaproteobacteria bacterium]